MDITYVPDPTKADGRSVCILVCFDPSQVVAFPQYSVPNFAALKALTTHNQDQIVTVQGLVSPTDGQGGGYLYQTTSMAVDDGITVGKPDNVDVSLPGRWLKYTG